MVIVGCPRPEATRLLHAAEKQILDVVSAMVLVDDRHPRIASFARKGEKSLG